MTMTRCISVYLMLTSMSAVWAQPPAVPPVSSAYQSVLIPDTEFKGFTSPDGLARDAKTGRVFVSEETRSVISVIQGQQITVLIDSDTPIRSGDATVSGLKNPEGIAWDPARQTLWVVEDRPGGRVLAYDLSDPRQPVGEAVAIPGQWSTFAWEGIAVNPTGELLLCGSDIEALEVHDGAILPTGVILFRDKEGDWWVPIQRLFASFSAVAFGPDFRRAIYTCELTGEIGWLDLETRRSIGGTANQFAVSPEGITVFPDGTFLVAEERGTVLHIDPSENTAKRIYEHPSSIESLMWDPDQRCVWVTDDGQGLVQCMSWTAPHSTAGNALDFAVYYPLYSPRNVPSLCPDFLKGIFALGGVDFSKPNQLSITFPEFTEKLPMIAAAARVEALNPNTVYTNPITEVQFILFEPNRLKPYGDMLGVSLAGFAAVRASGDLVRTTLRISEAYGGALESGHLSRLGDGLLMVPMPAAASVTPLGIASVTFLGLQQTPDYSLVINPRNPSESYMVVYLETGEREQYRLIFDDESEEKKNWVIGYSQVSHDGWQRLSYTPSIISQQTEEDASWPPQG